MTTSEPAFDGAQARAWVEQVRSLRRRARLARRGSWFPLVLFGLVTLGSTPLYLPPGAQPGPGTSSQQIGVVHTLGWFPGGLLTGSPTNLAIFWLVAGPLAYLATAAFYWVMARRRGVATSPWSYVATGLGLFALLVVTTTVGVFPFGDLVIRGLTPLLAVAIGLFVLARAERSWALFGFSAAFFALVVLANLYDMENAAYRLGLGTSGPQVNVVVVGAVLVLAGVGFALALALAGRRQSRQRRTG